MRFSSKTLLVLIASIGFASTASAVLPGFYVGGGIGASKFNNNSRTTVIGGVPQTISPDNKGIGERIFAGYVVGPYGAFEMGYTHFGSSNYKLPDTVSCTNPSVNLSGVDFTGKVAYPMSSFNVFAKGGFMIARQTQSSSLAASPGVISPCGTSGSSTPTTEVKPVLGIGASYDISQAWVADLSYTQTSGGGSIKSASLLALSLSYHFADKYCGQFLC